MKFKERITGMWAVMSENAAVTGAMVTLMRGISEKNLGFWQWQQ